MLVLLGRNGVGKTNVLLAIEWASQVGSSTSGGVPAVLGDVLGDVSLQVRLDGKLYEYRLCIDHEMRSKPDEFEQAVRVVREELRIELGGGWDTIFTRRDTTLTYGVDSKPLEIAAGGLAAFTVASLLPSDPVSDIIVKVMRFLHGVRYLPLDTPAKEENDYWVVRERDYIAFKAKTFKSASDAQRLHLRLLDLSKNEPARFQEFLDLVGANGLGIVSDLKINQFPFPTNTESNDSKQENYYFFRWMPVQSRGDVPGHGFGDLSYGTRRLLRLFITMLHERPSMMLIEQPEDGIHKGLLHKLVPTLESYCGDHQLILATHAADILNRAEPEQIRLVSMGEGETSVRTLTPDELDAAHAFVREEGPLADFLDMVQE
jgi:hypothetical protein